jgi:cell fate regulator YaaT (PSP1 superfamily)
VTLYIALRLRKLSVVYWFKKPEDAELFETQDIIVNTQHGVEVGRILRITDTKPANLDEETPFVTEFVRVVNDDDRNQLKDLCKKEKEAFIQARKKIEEHQLPMKLLKAEYLFDCSRLILYFKSDNKVDFRELLKSLASLFRTRIELRQIGVRDETKLLGGIGCCGKPVCCSQFMNVFYPVSTKMAKEQNLSLNPAKLSGICGRLLCCLAHEHEYYASFHGKYPRITAEVVVGEETGRVMDINYITRKVIIGFADKRKATFNLDDIRGRKDNSTGRNLWWVKTEGEKEPDLSVLLKNLNPPGTGKKKKKFDVTQNDDDSLDDETIDSSEDIDDSDDEDLDEE